MCPFADVDTAFREGIKDDNLIFDNKESFEIIHRLDEPTINWAAGTAAATEVYTIVDNCLQRQPSARNGPSVPQLHERAMSVQKDDFAKYDLVVEVPMLDDLAISMGDKIRRLTTNKMYKIVMLDVATLSTRYRLGCTIFV